MDLSVFGLGYVGSVTAACLADLGHRVVGVEVHPDKLAAFREGRIAVAEPGLGPLVERVHAAGLLTATDSAAEAVRSSELSFICVGTPSRKDGSPDLAHVERVAAEIGAALRDKGSPHVVAVRSTMLPGATEAVVVPAIERASGKSEGSGFHVALNPEFMREGSTIRDFLEPPFVLIGERAAEAGDALARLYAPIAAPRMRTSIRAAEAVKLACNAFHGLKITFANEIGQVCAAHGIDAREVMDVLCQDPRLNISPAYLRPGMAYGGSCLPKDLRALVRRARERDLDLPVLEAIGRSNLHQIQRTVDLVAELGSREVGVLGLSFKAGTDDLRESPVVIMAETLLGKGFRLAIHDSEVELTRLTGANKQFLDEKLPHIGSLLVPRLADVVAASRTLVVCKRHPDFERLADLTSAEHRVLDLVGLPGADAFPAGVYRGLYW
jgi:GDP-mannose 6-dehydrogenase